MFQIRDLPQQEQNKITSLFSEWQEGNKVKIQGETMDQEGGMKTTLVIRKPKQRCDE
jgi:hypothetical protein